MHRPRRLLFGALVTLLLSAAVIGPGVTTPLSAGTVKVNGAGSTWSAIAVQTWQADVASQGINIDYNPTGSSTGRAFYISDNVDFAVSEIPFQRPFRDQTGNLTNDEVAGAAARPYVYMPFVAGGTAFMYHLDINGKRFTNLRLGGATVSLVFTGIIKYWDDSRIKADNPGVPLPHLPITVVYRSDGSGTSAQFTLYMSKVYPSIWNAFCKARGLPTPCSGTSIFPITPGFVGASGSLGVSNYVAAPYANGAITYVEYGYAKQDNFPVASILNHAGYYRQPDAHNVAIALQGARRNPDWTINLDNVYTWPDPRSYPISSYSLMILPTTLASPMTSDKGKALSEFVDYVLCAGQQKAEQMGYSPLPIPLVQHGLLAETHLPGHVAPKALSQCANPAVTGTFVTTDEPSPAPADKAGQGANAGGGTQTGTDTGTGGSTTVTTAAASNGGSSGGSSGGNGANNGGGSRSSSNNLGGTTGTTAAGASTASGSGGGSGGGGGGGGSGAFLTGQSTGTQNVASEPISIHRDSGPVPVLLYIVAVLLVLFVVTVPPLLAMLFRRRPPGQPAS